MGDTTNISDKLSIDTNQYEIPARRWTVVHLNNGDVIKIINSSGAQVIDTWAFNVDDMTEYMSMEHSRASILKIVPVVGDVLVTNRRRPILALTEDTTPGTHDTLIAACDTYRYQELCGQPEHDNCTNNLAAALASVGFRSGITPCPFNLFMNMAVNEDGTLRFAVPTSQAGQYVCLRAEMPLLLVMSACPQDVTPVNAHAPSDAHYVLL